MSEYVPSEAARAGLPVEVVTFDEALSVVQEYYELQISNPIDSSWLHDFLSLPGAGSSTNVWRTKDFFYVYEGVVRGFYRRGGSRVIIKPARCLKVVGVHK